ncbi:MAG TPA: methyltransferase domain-containing protein [Acidobacteriota bacterium]|nr:methyltransferase domain-containing protein [Acidobacteriota bacterium]
MRFKMRLFFLSLLLLAALLYPCAPLKSDDTKAMRPPDVVYVGTPYDIVSKMLKMARIKKTDLVYDLGCGDGRILVLAAQKYGCRGVGYDIDPERVKASRDNVARNGVEKLVKIVQADIFTLDLQKANVIPIYLLPEMNRKLLPQLDKLKPGSRIVCHNYDLDGIVSDEVVEMVSNEDNSNHTLTLYTTPLKRKQ